MKTLSIALAAFCVLAATPAAAEEYFHCQGGDVLKDHVVHYKVQTAEGTLMIEKDGKTKGDLIQQKEQTYWVRAGGERVATFADGKIRVRDQIWTLADAKAKYSCEDKVAATLFGLEKAGKL